MKVRVTFDCDDDTRYGISHHYGKAHKATREECASTILSLASADLDLIVEQWRTDQEAYK